MNIQAIAIALADDLFVQCQTLSPWTVNYVDLEESLAVGSISQELLAQGGVLYEFAGLAYADRDKHIFQRSAADWHVSSLSFVSVDHWPDVVASAFLTTHASRIIVEALMQTSESAREQLSLVWREQVHHLTHWRQWISLLLVNPEIQIEITTAINRAIQKSGDLLPLGDDYNLLHQRWAEEVRTEIIGLGVSLTADLERSSRVSGGPSVERMIKNLRVARDPDGQSSYSIY
jgi:1,2-phenylacetyl-CoA epoxidase catalytic subunit